MKDKKVRKPRRSWASQGLRILSFFLAVLLAEYLPFGAGARISAAMGETLAWLADAMVEETTVWLGEDEPADAVEINAQDIPQDISEDGEVNSLMADLPAEEQTLELGDEDEDDKAYANDCEADDEDALTIVPEPEAMEPMWLNIIWDDGEAGALNFEVALLGGLPPYDAVYTVAENGEVTACTQGYVESFCYTPAGAGEVTLTVEAFDAQGQYITDSCTATVEGETGFTEPEAEETEAEETEAEEIEPEEIEPEETEPEETEETEAVKPEAEEAEEAEDNEAEPQYADVEKIAVMAGRGYSVVVRYNTACGIPEDAELTVSEITDESRYADYYANARDAMEDEDVEAFYLLDISLTADGAEYAGCDGYEVEILLDNAIEAEPSEVQAMQFEGSQARLLDTDVQVNGATELERIHFRAC